MNKLHLPIHFLTLLASLLVSNVCAYSIGAPICSISQASYNFMLQPPGTPMGVYNENITVGMQVPKDYTLGSGPIPVNITGNWAGILLFAENIDGDHVGEFEAPPNYRYVIGAAPECKNQNDRATLTHSTNSTKTGVTTFMWTPPILRQGALTFRCLIVAGNTKGFIAVNSTQVAQVVAPSSGTDISSGPCFWEFATVGIAFIFSIWGLGV